LAAGPLEVSDALRIGIQLAAALGAAHQLGVVHRDVKPANIMLIRDEPGLKLLDFGLAKLYDRVAEGSQTRTGTGLVVGTPAYMAPEQVRATDATDKTDVYAAGLVLFQLLTGRHVFEVDGASRIMASHVTTQAPDVRTLRDDVSEDLAALIAECLAKDPASRPNAAEMTIRLRGCADRRSAPPLHQLLRQNTARSILRRFS
jgi:serine/threonine protein kinase